MNYLRIRHSTSEATEASSAEPTSEAEPPAQELTEFGATVEAREAEHGDSVEGYADGTVYGPIVRDGVHEYFAVIAEIGSTATREASLVAPT